MLGEENLAGVSASQKPQDGVSREGRAACDRHGQILITPPAPATSLSRRPSDGPSPCHKPCARRSPAGKTAGRGAMLTVRKMLFATRFFQAARPPQHWAFIGRRHHHVAQHNRCRTQFGAFTQVRSFPEPAASRLWATSVTRLLLEMNSCCCRVNSCKLPASARASRRARVYSRARTDRRNRWKRKPDVVRDHTA